MSLMGRDWKSTLRGGVFSKVLAALLGGSLNQKVILVLGLAVLLGSFYYLLLNLWQPILFAAVGLIVIVLAVRDFDRGPGTGA